MLQPFFFLCDFCLNFIDHLCQFAFASFQVVCINVAGVLFTIRPDRGVAAFPEIFVNLGDAASTGFSAVPFVCLEGGGSGLSGSNSMICFSGRRFCNSLIDFCRCRSFCVLAWIQLLSEEVCYESAHDVGRSALRISRHMGIGIKGEGGFRMPRMPESVLVSTSLDSA